MKEKEKSLIMVSLDDVISLLDKSPKIVQCEKDLEELYINAKPNNHFLPVLREYNNNGAYEIHIVADRPTVSKEVTEDWLSKEDVPYTKLIMNDQLMPNVDFKYDIVIDQMIHKSPSLVIDANPSVAYLMEKLGLNVWYYRS